MTVESIASSTFESTRKIVDVEGLTFAYHEAGQGEPVIALHGSGPGVSAWANYQNNIPVFARRFRFIAPDLPGFAGSDAPKLDEFYPLLAARWIARLMDRLDIESAYFIGNSMGGAVVGELAGLHPERVKRMAVMGPGGLSVGIFGPEPSEGFSRLFEFLQVPTRHNMVAWLKTMLHDQTLITEALIDERMRNATADGAIERMSAIFGSMFDPRLQASYVPLWTRAHKIATPTLMLWGRDDRMLPYDQAHFAIRRVPNIELHTFPRCGHWIQTERKVEFERVVTEFLTRDASDGD